MVIFNSIKPHLTQTGLFLLTLLLFGYTAEIIPLQMVILFTLMNLGFMTLGKVMLQIGKVPTEEDRVKRQELLDQSMVLGVVCSMIILTILKPMLQAF